jgi:GH43 family beta-xylosidase
MRKQVIGILGGILLASVFFSASAGNLEPLALRDPLEIAGRFYQNPLPVSNIGDPFILPNEGKYYLYATGSPAGFYEWSSTDLKTFAGKKKALQRVTWATGDYWAPEVYAYKGKYVMVFSARRASDSSLRVGIAFADKPQGPYKDPLGAPLFDPGYAAIDASLFIDSDGTPYLYYVRDCSENTVGPYHESHIYAARLAPDLLSLTGDPVLLTSPDQAWELYSGDYRWNEGPVVLRHEDKYYLFYSANYFASKEYGVGVAVSDSPLGPYVKAETNPLLTYTLAGGEVAVSGPGHNSFFTAGNELFTAYHTHTYPTMPSGNRQLCIDRAGFHADGTAYINGPTLYRQLLPYNVLDVINTAPLAALITEGSYPQGLTDGDCCVSPASKDYVFKGKAVIFTYATPVTADTVMLYPGEPSRVKGTIVINESYTAMLDFSNCPDVPGACLTLCFEPIMVNSVRLMFEEAVSLGEVLILGK